MRQLIFVAFSQRILQADYKWPPNAEVSDECRDLIARMLVLNPAHRLTAAEIQQHPFFLQDLPLEWYQRQKAFNKKLPDLPGSLATPLRQGPGSAPEASHSAQASPDTTAGSVPEPPETCGAPASAVRVSPTTVAARPPAILDLTRSAPVSLNDVAPRLGRLSLRGSEAEESAPS